MALPPTGFSFDYVFLKRNPLITTHTHVGFNAGNLAVIEKKHFTYLKIQNEYTSILLACLSTPW